MKKFSLYKNLFFLCSLAVALNLIFSCDKKIGYLPKAGPCDSVKYSTDIQPILTANCNACHPTLIFADFSNYDGTKAKVDDGKFALRVLNLKDMPLGIPLSQGDLEKIQCWLDKGAPNN